VEHQVWLRVLGPVQLRGASGEWWSPPRPQLRVLLAFLALSAGQVTPAGDLVDVLWEERAPQSARASLQILIVRLRKALAEVPDCVIERYGEGYQLHFSPRLADVHAFRSMVAAAREARDNQYAIAVLGQALALWRGPAVADVRSTMRVEAIRSGLTEEHLSAVQDRFGRLLAAGRDTEVAAEIPLMLARYPLAERLAGMLMTAWYRSGRRAEALHAFHDLRRRLVRELGVEPGDELQHLHQRMLSGDPGLAWAPGQPRPKLRVVNLAAPAGAVSSDGMTVSRQRQLAQKHAANGSGVVSAGTASSCTVNAGPSQVQHSSHQQTSDRHTAPDIGDDRRQDAPSLTRVVPRQLPAAPAHFAGRHREVRSLTMRLGPRTDDGPTIVVISGIPGVGKTALALQWTHQVQQRFPDGQLYANLRGFDASPAPMTAAEAISVFLAGMGVAPSQISPQLDAQVALYRSLLADKRMLIVLDNVRDEAQVRPLLPGSPACLVLMTSRNELTGLIAAEGASPIRLDVLGELEAQQLLASRLGPGRVAAEATAVAELTSLCAHLPLALVLAAAQAATRPTLPLAGIADGLRSICHRLDGLNVGDKAMNIEGVFSWSYRLLSEPAARMFRLLAVHTGPDISVAAAASLAAVSARSAGAAISELVAASLVQEQAPGRFTVHDLLRAYASGLGDETERRDGIRRVLDYYLQAARTAVGLVYPAASQLTVTPPCPDVEPERFTDSRSALAWLQAEHQVLLAAIAAAADSGLDDHAWQLPSVLREYFARRGHYRDWADSQQVALAAARRLRDDAAQALALRSLGEALIPLGSWQDARSHLLNSVALYGKLGDHSGQAGSHCGMAMLSESEGDYAQALYHAQRGLRLYRAVDDLAGQASALNGVGWDYALLGNHQRALRYCNKALELHRDAGNRFGEAVTLDSLGFCYHQVSRHGEAIMFYQLALGAYADIDDRYLRASTLVRLGETHQACGNPQAAHDNWQQAADILDDLHHHDAEAVRARLQDATITNLA
jgi:DNA-binding SARP family transcriptional activator/tetratricopeptide (TPR) repeat protein